MKLSVNHLAYGYKNKKPLWKDVSFSVNKGEIFSILGSNGAGKSTLLRCLIGFLAPKEGSVLFEDDDGHSCNVADENSGFNRLVGYVPQMQDTAYSFDLRDYVIMGRAPYLGMFQSPGASDYEKADEIMDEMGIYDFRDQPFNTLSGGQQRQAVIARAILQDPKMIIMDEPTNHLDYGNQFRVIEMIEKLADRGMTIILTTHMPDHVLYLGRRAGILMDGTMCTGNVEEVITEENLKKIYHIPVHMVYLKEFNRTVCVAG